MSNILCIDIGNTNIVLGLTSEDKRDFYFKKFRMITNHNITADEVSLNIFNVLNFFKVSFSEVSKVIVSSVVPEVDVQFRNGIKKIIGLEPKFVNIDEVPIEVIYENRKEIGSDRLVDAYASKVLYGDDCMIVDTGTATTIDIVIDGNYNGGVIMPGIQTSLYAIFQKASKIPKVSLETPKKIIGRNTEESLRIGIIVGLAKGVEGIIKEMYKEVGKSNFKIIFTGGMSNKIFEFVDVDNKILDKDLMLKGLKLLA
ncbi:MAG: type III pantothenate kinase [Brevinematia bacterium]